MTARETTTSVDLIANVAVNLCDDLLDDHNPDDHHPDDHYHNDHYHDYDNHDYDRRR